MKLSDEEIGRQADEAFARLNEIIVNSVGPIVLAGLENRSKP